MEWERIPESRGYYLEVRDRYSGNIVYNMDLDDPDWTSYEVAALVGNLSWFVVSKNGVIGCPETSSEMWNYAAFYKPPPEIPTKFKASDGAYSDRIRISWEQPPSDSILENWELRKSTTPNFADSDWVDAYLYEQPEYIDTDVIPNQTYYYWIRACSHSDGCSEYTGPETGTAGSTNVELRNSLFIPLINR